MPKKVSIWPMETDSEITLDGACFSSSSEGSEETLANFAGQQTDPFTDPVKIKGHSHGLSIQSRASGISYRHFSLPPPSPNDQRNFISDPAGTEPGIDVKTTMVQLANAVGSDITIVDYSPTRHSHSHTEVRAGIGGVQGVVIEDLLAHRPSWSKVRWICVNGLSWEAIEPITEHFSLHPLAIEDMLDIPQRTKMDVFANHVFCCFPLHMLGHVDIKKSQISAFMRSIKKMICALCGLTKDGISSHGQATPVTCVGRACNGRRGSSNSQSSAASIATENTISSLKERISDIPSRNLYQWDRGADMATNFNKVRTELQPPSYSRSFVTIEQVSLFMTKDTVITFFEQSAPKVLQPVMNRIFSDQTLLRQTSDPAILAQAIVDTCVDLIAPIVHEYSRRLNELQAEAIKSPTLSHTRALHMLSTELTILRSTVGSISPMVNSFRTKGGDRTRRDSSNTQTASVGFFNSIVSDMAALYFGDVADHVMSYARHLSIMSEQARNMTTLIFNTISIRSSDSVRLLSLVTVVFLPLTFLTGYFGMNFTDFAQLNNGVDFYWEIAAPFSAGLLVLLTYSWFMEKMAQFKSWLVAWD